MAERRDNGAMRKIWAVAFREVRHTVLTKGFIFGALVVPVLMFGAIAAIGLLVGMQVAPVSGTVALIDPSGSVAEFARTELTPEQVAKVKASHTGRFLIPLLKPAKPTKTPA